MGGAPGTGGNKDMVYRDIDPNTLVTNTGAPAGGPPPPPANTGSPYGASNYSVPTYGLTPQSGYQGLAQQLQQAFKLSPQAYAAPRTNLLDMYATPWNSIYGGPQGMPFAQMWGQDPMQGRAPPPGTAGFLGPQTNTNTPLPPASGFPEGPRTGPPAPPAPPGTSAPSSPGPIQSAPPAAPPTGGGPRLPPTFPGSPSNTNTNTTTGGGLPPHLKGLGLGGGDRIRRGENGNFATSDGPGIQQLAPGFMQSFGAAGGDVGRYGAMAAMMAQKQNEMAGGGMSHGDVFKKFKDRKGKAPSGAGYLPTTPINLWNK